MAHRISPVLVVASVVLLTLAACGEDEPQDTPEAEEYETVTITPPVPEPVDLVMVIDDSGSMCGEQQAIAQNIDAFINEFATHNIDFHIGVTSTSPDENGELGALNQVPNPIPDASEGCDVTPELVQTQITRAAACTWNPAEHSISLTSEQASCIEDASNCTIDGFEIADLFPPESAYRDFPTVLKRDDYIGSDGLVDVEKFRADLACVSFVGTNGSSFEKGLGALVAASSPERVGTYYDPSQEPPAGASNYGLIRQDAQPVAMILSDENDCTYDNDRAGIVQTIDENGACGDAACYYANSTALEEGESPLVPPQIIAQEWATNLRDVKQQNVDIDDLSIASLHGRPSRYDGEWPATSACEAGTAPEVEAPCTSQEFGSAYSGDRYQRMVELFPDDQRYPGPGESLEGRMCLPDDMFAGLFNADSIGPREPCINYNPAPCETAADCAEPRVPGVEKTCRSFAATDEGFCYSSITAVVTTEFGMSDPAAQLADTGICIEGSIGVKNGQGTCFLRPELLEYRTCAANDRGLHPSLDESVVRLGLDGFNLELQVPKRAE